MAQHPGMPTGQGHRAQRAQRAHRAQRAQREVWRGSKSTTAGADHYFDAYTL